MLTTMFVPLPIIAAAEGTTVGAFTVTGGENGTDYSYADNVLTISKTTAITIKNTDPSTATTDTIVVASENGANITLSGVNIDVSSTERACAFNIDSNVTEKVTITLADGSENTLKSGESYAGLQKSNSANHNLEITGDTLDIGSLTANGGRYGAGIGGGLSSAGSDIVISGGSVTANSATNGAGIGGGHNGEGSNITISGSSVKATRDTGGSHSGAIIGNGAASRADGAAVTPTNGTTAVYLYELGTTGVTAVTISGKSYPTKHGTEDKIYVHLPAGTGTAPNEITVGDTTTKFFYDTTAKKWITTVEKPAADTAEFTYNGKQQTYTLDESDYYTITGNKQTNAGDYTVTVALKDKDNTVWSDGSTVDLTDYTSQSSRQSLK